MKNSISLKKERKDILIDALELAILVIGIVVVLRLVFAMYRDKQEHDLAKSEYYTQTEEAMLTYSALHMGGNSYASMIYSENYKNYDSIETAEAARAEGILLCGNDDPVIVADK